MKLPNIGKVLIGEAKLTSYLLSETHPVGRSKAAYFRTVGYDLETAQVLRRDLLWIAETGTVIDRLTTPFGDKYIIDGIVQTPTEKMASLRTIWLLEQAVLRFISAYPTQRAGGRK